MGNDVFANGREVSCKKADGKSICAFPDVCFTPPDKVPPTPPGVPIPYPNTGFAKDCTKGSKKVKISDNEVMLKNKSHFKTSTGDEAGCAQKKGLISSKTKGKIFFTMWSMDVKFEKKNVVRHLDTTTHNHGSGGNEAIPWPYVDSQAAAPGGACHDSMDKEKKACDPNASPPGSKPRMVKNKKGKLKQKGNTCTKECAEARACALPKKKDDKKVCCHPDTTGDHLVEVNSFTEKGGRQGAGLPSEAVISSLGIGVELAEPKSRPRRLTDFGDYNDEAAPTACVKPPGAGTNHNRMQEHRDGIKRRHKRMCGGVPLQMWSEHEESFWTYDEAASAGVASHQKENPQCDPKCTRAQLDSYHHEILPGDTVAQKNATPVRTYIPRG